MFGSMIPWRDRFPGVLMRMDREIGDLMERAFGTELREWPGEGFFAPTTNVAETETALEVTLELPGMKPDDFNVEFKNGDLWITGEKKEEKEEKGKNWHRVESRYGQFRRVVEVPVPVKEEKVQAEYKDGILRISVPKAEAAKPKKIVVKA